MWPKPGSFGPGTNTKRLWACMQAAVAGHHGTAVAQHDQSGHNGVNNSMQKSLGFLKVSKAHSRVWSRIRIALATGRTRLQTTSCQCPP